MRYINPRLTLTLTCDSFFSEICTALSSVIGLKYEHNEMLSNLHARRVPTFFKDLACGRKLSTV